MQVIKIGGKWGKIVESLKELAKIWGKWWEAVKIQQILDKVVVNSKMVEQSGEK